MNANSVQQQTIQIPMERVTLEGDLTIPADPRGMILFAHGSGSSRLSPRNQFVAQELVKAGFATLLFDLLTPGEELEEQETRHLRFDIPLLATRLTDATDWTLRQPNLQGLPIGYFGASTGAAAALIGGAQRSEQVRAVVSRGGRPDLAHEALPMVNAPTLLIVGGRDELVIKLNESAMRLLTCEKRMEIVPGATHLFEEPGALEHVAALARDWFVQWLCGCRDWRQSSRTTQRHPRFPKAAPGTQRVGFDRRADCWCSAGPG